MLRFRLDGKRLFITGGSIGVSLGPIFVANALRVLGPHAIALMAIPGVALSGAHEPATMLDAIRQAEEAVVE